MTFYNMRIAKALSKLRPLTIFYFLTSVYICRSFQEDSEFIAQTSKTKQVQLNSRSSQINSSKKISKHKGSSKQTRQIQTRIENSFHLLSKIINAELFSKILGKVILYNFHFIFSLSTNITIYQIFKSEEDIKGHQILKVILKTKNMENRKEQKYMGIELSFPDHTNSANWFDFNIIKFGFTTELSRCYKFLDLTMFLHGFEQLVPYMNHYKLEGRLGRKASKTTFNVVIKEGLKSLVKIISTLMGLKAEAELQFREKKAKNIKVKKETLNLKRTASSINAEKMQNKKIKIRVQQKKRRKNFRRIKRKEKREEIKIKRTIKLKAAKPKKTKKKIFRVKQKKKMKRNKFKNRMKRQKATKSKKKNKVSRKTRRKPFKKEKSLINTEKVDNSVIIGASGGATDYIF